MTTRHPQGTLVAVDIPWGEQNRLDESKLRGLIDRLVTLGYDEYYVMGTAGEGYALTDGQYREIVDVFVDEMAGRGKRTQVGVISLATSQVIERIAYAYGRGVRTFQISLPSWGVLTDAEMLTFFETVCGEYPDAHFLHYNLLRSGRIVTGHEYRPIIDRVPNLAATKIAIADMSLIRGWMTHAPELQHFFLQAPYPYAAQFGECSLLSSMAGVAPTLTKAMWDAGRTGDIAAAQAAGRRMLDAREGLVGDVKSAYMDGAFDKLFAWLADPDFPRRLLPPYATISDAEAELARTWLDANRDWFR